MITADNYEISYCGKASQGLVPAKIRENMESLNPDKFKIRKFGVSDVIAITAAGKSTFYYSNQNGQYRQYLYFLCYSSVFGALRLL